MAKPIRLTSKEWKQIRNQLQSEFEMTPSVFLIREVMRRELGFTTRYHREWVPDPGYDSYGKYEEFIFLDFYNDAQETFFRLKYL